MHQFGHIGVGDECFVQCQAYDALHFSQVVGERTAVALGLESLLWRGNAGFQQDLQGSALLSGNQSRPQLLSVLVARYL